MVDLDASGQEVFSERKVQQLKETCAIVYVRVREFHTALVPPAPALKHAALSLVMSRDATFIPSSSQRDVDYLKKRIARKAAREGGADSNRPNLDPTKGYALPSLAAS